jgi:putative transcriptional regulator
MKHIPEFSGLQCRESAMEDLEFENSLKLARIEQGMTQSELSERAGVTRQTIGLIEAGRYNPTLKLCLLLARITGKRLDELFWIKGEK